MIEKLNPLGELSADEARAKTMSGSFKDMLKVVTMNAAARHEVEVDPEITLHKEPEQPEKPAIDGPVPKPMEPAERNQNA